jgi:hypothetical protein
MSIVVLLTRLAKFPTKHTQQAHGCMSMALSVYGCWLHRKNGIWRQGSKKPIHGQLMGINGSMYRMTMALCYVVIPKRYNPP